MIFVDLEKAYDNFFGEVMWWVLEKTKGENNRTVIKDIYNRTITKGENH